MSVPLLAADERPDRGRDRSEDGVWTRRAIASDGSALRPRFGHVPRAFEAAEVDPHELRNALSRAPLEAAVALGPQLLEIDRQPKPILTVPMPDGTFARLAIEESPILSPEMQRLHPEIRTYRGEGVDDPTMTARLDTTPLGFHGMVMSDRGTAYIDPSNTPNVYISYWHRDLGAVNFRCLYRNGQDGRPDLPPRGPKTPVTSAIVPFPNANPTGTQLRTYRLAVSVTGEYGAYFGGVTQANAQIATTMNRVTGLYERDLTIRFTIVATRVYTDASTDPFTGQDAGVLRGENQTELDTNVGSANYDIGHIMSQGGTGGIATLGVTCQGGSKARGATSLAVPAGDGFDVDFVAHEMGHQMGGDHTFDGTSDSNCNDNRVASSAYEPGSGTTIMAYAGVCGAENIQPHSDPVFHSRSYDQIRALSLGSGACGTVTNTGDTPPVPNAGADYTIPQSTPFTLTGSGTDANGDTLTYAWEQFDLGPGIGQPTPTYSGPLFRSYADSSSASRTIPPLAALFAGTATPWEVLAGANRDLNFRLTVRDQRGGSDYDSMVVHVSGAQFAITGPASPLQCASSPTLTWQVGGATDPNVQAAMSLNNGSTFPLSLFSSTANDGSESFTLPKQTFSNQAWIKLQPLGNIYFALKGPLSIVDTLAPAITAPANVTAECTGASGTGVTLGTATASDSCWNSVTISNNAPSAFSLGSTTVTWTATDGSGNTATATQTVTIQDTVAPTLSVSLTPSLLWPANHKLIDIHVNATATDVCDSTPAIHLVSITSNEPDEGLGDGDMPGDVAGAAFGTDDRDFQLRAERSGLGTGRVYTITYEAVDDSGNTTVQQLTVTVPRDQR
jgi:hypothetical protein